MGDEAAVVVERDGAVATIRLNRPEQSNALDRASRAALALASSRRPVIAVALDAGFGDLSTFNKTFRAVFGLTPTQYRDMRR